MDFSFKGVNISKQGLHYIPKAESIYVWGNEYDTHELKIDSEDGGYWFGTTVKPKRFELECFFEELTHLQLEKIQYLFKRGTTGALVFDERPFLTYIATVTEFKSPEIYVGNSGTLTVSLTAYYPFSFMDRLYATDFQEYGEANKDRIKGVTGLLTAAKTPPTVIDTSIPITESKQFLLYNPGSEGADTIIRIAGDVGTGVLIYNAATKQSCTVEGLTKTTTSNMNKWLEIDSRTGKVYMTDGTTPVMSFLYHDDGFIQLEGSAPIDRDVPITYTGNVVSSAGSFTPDMQGKYILIDGNWRKITYFIDECSMEIDYTYGAPGSAVSDIVIMNLITVVPDSNMEITKLEFYYAPTFR